jgi:hypothetical protein
VALAEGAVEQRVRPIQPYLLEPHGSKHLEQALRKQEGEFTASEFVVVALAIFE